MAHKRQAIVLKELQDLHPDPKNPRKNDAAVPAVAESIRMFGFKVPIVVDENDNIIAGHTRYKAAKQLGLEKVPCIVADDLNEKELKAFQLADNKTGELATWDSSMLNIELSALGCLFDMSKFGFIEEKDKKDKGKDKDGQQYVVCPRCGRKIPKNEKVLARAEEDAEGEMLF